MFALQAAPPPVTPFTDKERGLYAQKSEFGSRMEFFDDVIKRYRKDFEHSNKAGNVGQFVRLLSDYEEYLKIVHDDIEKAPVKKSKSKGLRKLEIQMRNAREDLQNFKVNAPADQLEAFDKAIESTDSVRTFILQLIFGKDFLKSK